LKYVGRSIPGLTNTQLAAGKGTFVDDIQLPGMAYMAVLRSPYAHARIRSVDTTKAGQLPGVLYAISGEEIQAHTNPIPENYDPRPMGAKQVKWYALCPDRARFVGEAVAAVVARDKFTAYEAVKAIDVDYEELPAVVDPEEALKPGAPLVEPEWGDNIFVSRDFEVGNPTEAFDEADGTVSGIVQCNRVTGTAIEPRGIVASYDPYKPLLTVWDSTQDPHPLRLFLAETLRMSENEIHVIQPHVGGGFGLKQPTFQEEPLTAYLSRKLGRPVKWIEERFENFQVGGHARDTRFYYEAAYKKDGTVTGLKLRVIADIGAPSSLCGWGMSFVTWYCLPTFYKIPNVRMQLSSVVTNKCPWNSYRGYGKDAATFLMERVIDHVAKSISMDRADIRFKNFIPANEFPCPRPSGAILDSGNYAGALSKVLDLVDRASFEREQAEERSKGRYLGLGISMEMTPEGASMPGSAIVGGYDGATVRVYPTGEVTVLTGVTSPGSGNETAMAQIAAEVLGADIARVKVIQGDTESCPWGLGNYSSRSVILGGSAVYDAATAVREKMFDIAARMLGTPPDDLEAAGGRIQRKGSTADSVSLEDIARQAYRHPHGEFMEEIEPALEATRHFRIANVYHQPETQGRFSSYPTWSNAAAACIVEVDPKTGFVKILRYCLVHDAGRIVNPLLADANLHGGITQGIGGAMYEQIVYDEVGQIRTSTFMDYTIPTAVETINYEVDHQETLSPFTRLGTKGVGESGVGGALNALCSAIEDALPHLDLHITSLPLTPQHVWRAITNAHGIQLQ
jgi:aerobic carbon-monoxide dehydrogenase large subunit